MRPFPNFPDGRIIFALSINRARLEATFFKSDIRNALVSFFYLNYPQTFVGRRSLAKLFKRVSEKSKVVYIDSGIFTIKGQVLKTTASGKSGTVAKARVADMQRAAKAQIRRFIDFGNDYAKWLTDNDDYYDWAFDLDVDQFLGLGIANKFWDFLSNNVPNPKKIIRIWHSTRTFDEWVAWCESGEHVYLAIEGGGSHSRDPHFYNRYVDVAHKNGVKVHILAATDFKFMQQVPFDTGDSSSWMAGSQYGYVYTPFGRVTFAERKWSATTPNWATIPADRKEKIIGWLKDNGLPYKQSILQKSWQAREMINIACFLQEDKPYSSNGQFRQVSFLDGA